MKKIIVLMILIASVWGYEFNTSSQLAYYFIQDVEGYEIQPGDWIYAFCGDECVGGKAWQGTYTDIPVYGDEGSDDTEGYCYAGEVPSFVIVPAEGDQISITNIKPQQTSQGMSVIGWSQFNMPIVIMKTDGGISTGDIKIVFTIEDGVLKAWKVNTENLTPVE